MGTSHLAKVPGLLRRWREHRSRLCLMRIFISLLTLIIAVVVVVTASLGINSSVTLILTGVMGGFIAFILWPRKRSALVVLKLAGVSWSEEDFCRGWEIDGRTGSGKTASAVIPIIYQLKKYQATVGILALDTKGGLERTAHPDCAGFAVR
jgi:hypothetical protein